ncbi:ABC transporter ATP-binding protein [Virgisporangium aurantiacum]|uniref:Lipoprotein-releasing system ATP-binding protein LolD n=1 Tax=Virgisporangium aurantiacum TaxID=175570 RepID=A0A8J3Z2I5_9ACTN|nr:ABC transporter ATP-binding protein [Virgisporangium aurantiacum]GIJ54135.1 lipoprotein-releasing system ATP-binding protein LolD [Virgisporangium aurantiacum]
MTVAGAGLYHIYREGEIETVALRGADIVLAPSSWTSLMGPSGSGKSTLLHILAGLLTPTAGSVIVDGTDLTKADPVEKARRRRRIGVVLQRDNLHPGLDVVDNVALPLRLDGRPGGSARERARQLLAEVGLAGYRRRRVGQLSGGESQRVAIAVALASRPAVLLADEPTGELDEDTAAGVLDVLETVRVRENTAILTVTHNRQVAERAGRRLLMRDGVVVDER